MRPEARPILAIDVGGTRARLAILCDGSIVRRAELPTTDLLRPAGSGTRDIVAGLAEAAASIAREQGERPAAVGVALAAAIDRDGFVLQERPFGIPAGARLRDTLGAAVGGIVALDNDANLAALAESELGAAAGAAAAAVLTIGTNIGLGLVLDGRVVRGAHGAAGEVGLLLVPTDDGPATTAGEGRLADAGRFGRVRSAAPAGYAFIEELVGGAALAAASSTGTSAGLSLGDPAVDPIAARAIEGWALVIADLGVVLDLDRVVLTGRVAASAAHLIDRLRTRVAELVALPPEIRLGALGPDAELLGADLLARAALASRDRQDARAGLSAQRRGGDR